MNSFKMLLLLAFALLGGCNTKEVNNTTQTNDGLVEFRCVPVSEQVKIDSTIAASDTSSFPVIQKYQNVSKILDGETPVLRYQARAVYKNGYRLRNCRCKVKQDTLFLNFTYGFMSVHSFTVKVVQNKFKLFAQYITDTASGYYFKTLAQSLTLNKKQYHVNDTLIGSVDFSGITNNPWGPELPDYFAKIQGTIKCKLQPWNAFQVKRYGIRWDNEF